MRRRRGLEELRERLEELERRYEQLAKEIGRMEIDLALILRRLERLEERLGARRPSRRGQYVYS